MNSLLPNLRWLSIPSDKDGHDWLQKSIEIDESLEGLGLDLMEETVYLLYSASPDEVLAGTTECIVARPVIGPKKTVGDKLTLVDWTSASVYRETLTAETFDLILKEASQSFSRAKKALIQPSRPFMLRIQRRLEDKLLLSVEAIFYQ